MNILLTCIVAFSIAGASDLYEVKEGDTLSEIAKSHGLTLEEIILVNPEIENADFIVPKQRIHVHSPNDRRNEAFSL
jgi:N-acetylmuramoyl-L-alanine amidase